MKSVFQNTRAHTLDLYRRICREIPRTIAIYDLDMTEAQVRRGVRSLFDEHREARDPRLVRILLEKAELEFHETVEQWKQKSHLHRLLGHDDNPEVVLPQHQGESQFLRDFYNNK